MDKENRNTEVGRGMEMTSEEYREELNKIFSDIHENYKLRCFYRFIIEKLNISC